MTLRLGRGASASLLLHAAILLVFVQFLNEGHDWSVQNLDHAPKTVEVRTLSEKEFRTEWDRREKQIVQMSDDQRNNGAPVFRDKIRLSKNNYAVDRETRAAKVGKFANNSNDALGDLNARGRDATSEPAHLDEVKKLFQLAPNPKDMEALEAGSRKTGRLRRYDLQRAPASASHAGSATDDHLPDVAIGVNTLLNTREYKFYGFFERIRARLTEAWHAELGRRLTNAELVESALAVDRTTKLAIELRPDGTIKSLRIVGSSGFDTLDAAATEAFQGAAPFPNPPKDMIEAEEVVKIRWDFVVLAQSAQGPVEVQVRRGGF